MQAITHLQNVHTSLGTRGVTEEKGGPVVEKKDEKRRGNRKRGSRNNREEN